MAPPTPPTPGRDPDVLIIGAGPVGLTAAAELVRHGARVRIVDQRDGPVKYSQALVVHVRTQEILGAMGIADRWVQAGHAIKALRFHAFGKLVGTVHPGGLDSPYPDMLGVSQRVTETLLVEHLERLGVSVERQVEATAFSQDADGVSATLCHLGENRRESTARAAWLVDCEGSSSKAREACGIPFDGERYTGQEFVMADAHVHWTFPHGDAYGFIEKKRVLMCLPFDAAGHYRVLCFQPEPVPERKKPVELAEIEKIARQMTGERRLRLSDPQWVTRFRTQHRLAGRFREKRVFLAGDAGHVHVPIGGQGMNYGMGDAFNLAWKLGAVIRGEARPEPLLNSYNAERHRVDESLIHGTDESYRSLATSGWWKDLALRFAAPAALSLETVQAKVRAGVSGLKIAYPGSPVVEDHGGGGGPAAGERAPDAALVRFGEQEAVTLFGLFYAGTRWTLLLFAGVRPTAEACARLAQPAAAVLGEFGHLINAHFVLTDMEIAGEVEGGSVLVDRDGATHARYGVKNACFYLVRPDGHVGFRGPVEKAGELMSYLFRIGLVGKKA